MLSLLGLILLGPACAQPAGAASGSDHCFWVDCPHDSWCCTQCHNCEAGLATKLRLAGDHLPDLRDSACKRPNGFPNVGCKSTCPNGPWCTECYPGWTLVHVPTGQYPDATDCILNTRAELPAPSAELRTAAKNSTTTNIYVVLFDDFNLLDVFGPLELFALKKPSWNAPNYSYKLVAETRFVKGFGGAEIKVDYLFEDYLFKDYMPAADLLFVPGGPGTRDQVNNEKMISWLSEQVDRSKEIFSVCTGAALLAKTGKLAGITATTNKLAYDFVVKQGPANWEYPPRWTHDGKWWTSGGVSAGMDLAVEYIGYKNGADVETAVKGRAEYGNDYVPPARPDLPSWKPPKKAEEAWTL